MTKLEGITPDESVFHRIRCMNENLWGELVITNKGIVFLKFKGVLGDGRERFHEFDFDEINRVQTEKNGSGIFKHNVVIDHHPKSSKNRTYNYGCEEYKARLFRALFERQKLLLKTPKEIKSRKLDQVKSTDDADSLNLVKVPRMKFYHLAAFLEQIEDEILSLLEHRYEVDLVEVATNELVHSLIARLHISTPRRMPKDQVYHTVNDLVTHLILRGELDGIVTEAGSYVSKDALARITVPFEMLADFETIHAQLKEKGLLIWTLDCPACSRKIKYPKNGKEIACQFCGNVIPAVDIFQKFKGLL